MYVYYNYAAVCIFDFRVEKWPVYLVFYESIGKGLFPQKYVHLFTQSCCCSNEKTLENSKMQEVGLTNEHTYHLLLLYIQVLDKRDHAQHS